MQTNEKIRSPRPAFPAVEGAATKERIYKTEHAFTARKVAEAADPIAPRLLLEATRAAGMFQRSALGHLDHHEWLDRVRTDGQRLMNVLTEMGFTPSLDRH